MHGSLERHSPPPLSVAWLRSTQQPESDAAGAPEEDADADMSCQQCGMMCTAGLQGSVLLCFNIIYLVGIGCKIQDVSF